MQHEVVKKFAAPVPRYTSYPTAPHFSGEIGPAQYRKWLSAIPEGEAISLYVHIPYCDELCWYCGCNTKATRKYAPVTEYLGVLAREIKTVGAIVGKDKLVTHMHWGGGSPSILSAADIANLSALLRENFTFAPDAEIAVEVDPRNLADDKFEAFAKAGVNRVSIGVQDFSEAVQKAINRHQGFELTERAIRRFRDVGVKSINLDLVYGLPLQTKESVENTIRQVLTLAPDRIALFGYAHLPSRLVHQKMIKDEDLPGPMQRFEQSNASADMLIEAGYVRIGLDHYAKPTDTLASGNFARNFQGYTTDDAETLIGLGASSIGKLKQGYIQNAVAVADYTRRINDGGLATTKGIALSRDDEVRAHVIAELLCRLKFSAADIANRYGADAEPVINDARALIANDNDGLLAATGTDGSFEVTEKGRLFVRSICAKFDAYLGKSTATHASGV